MMRITAMTMTRMRKVFPAASRLPCVLLFLLQLQLQAPVTNGQVPTTFYTFPTNAQFRCNVDAPGSKCYFSLSDYNSDPIVAESGTLVTLPGQTLFTASSPATDVLSLTNCKKPPCYVKCEVPCNCTFATVNTVNGTVTSNGTACPQVESAPTKAPTRAPTRVPVSSCPNTTDTSLCPRLMNLVAVTTKCDCYNFCNNSFLSCCDQGQCGNLNCSSNNPAGSLYSFVGGCRDSDRAKPTPAPASAPTKGSGAAIPATTITLTTTRAAVAVATIVGLLSLGTLWI